MRRSEPVSKSVVEENQSFAIAAIRGSDSSNLDSHSKGRTMEKLEICLCDIFADPFDVSGSRVTNHAASSGREGHSCSEGGAIERAPVGKGTVVLKAARLIDGTGAAPINDAVVVVTDNLITAVGAAGSVNVPANAKVIDLGNVTLMPGFIDAH